MAGLTGVVLVVVEVVRTRARHGVPNRILVVHRVHGEGVLTKIVAADVVAIGSILVLVLVGLDIFEILIRECSSITTELWLVTCCGSVLARDVRAPTDKWACGLPLVVGQSHSEVHSKPKQWCGCAHLHFVAQDSRDLELAGSLNDDLMVEIPQDARQAGNIGVQRRVDFV